MTAASQQITSVSFRGVQLFSLDADGYPLVSSTTEYAGIRIIGAKALTLNMPEWQRLTATGDDRVLAQFVLPPQEGVTGEARVGALDMISEALAAGVNVKTIGASGEAKALVFGTDKVTLPTLGVLGWRGAKSVADGDEGRGHYEWILMQAKLSPVGGEWGERTTEERRMLVTAQVIGRWIWGEALAVLDEGVTEMQGAIGSSEYIPRICAFEGDGVEDEFTFGREAVSTDKIIVFVDGVEDVTVTKAVGGLTFVAAPADGAKIVVWMEVAN